MGNPHAWNKGISTKRLGKSRPVVKKVQCQCVCCGETFQRWESLVGRFCSRKCNAKYHLERHNHLANAQASKKSSETRKGKPILSLRGEKHHQWIADRTKLVKRQERNDSAYKSWRREVYKRDGWKCKIGDENCEGKIVAHHILPWIKFPELRYKVTNGITLCHHHHPLKRKEEIEMAVGFKKLVNKTNQK